MSAYDFDVQYRPGKNHGNADGMSRCPNPRDCECNVGDSLEDLKCGPCKKCRKRAEDMHHMFYQKVCDGQTEGDPEMLKVTRSDERATTVGKLSQQQTEGDLEKHRVARLDKKETTLGRQQTGDSNRAQCLTFEDFWVQFIFLWCSICSILGVRSPSRNETTQSRPAEEKESGCYRTVDFKDDGRIKPKLASIRAIAELRPNKEDDPWFQGYSSQDLESLQKDDPNIGPVIEWMKHGQRPQSSKVAKP